MRIAHFSDVHMLGGDTDVRTRLASWGKRLDPDSRRRKFLASLREAMREADHAVVTGDLTETGLPAQFEALAEALAEARVDPDRITLVPGNHDAYGSEGGWSRALAGSLAPFRAGAGDRAGKIVDRGDLVILPLDVSFHQPVGLAAGALSDAAASAIEWRLRDPALRDRAVLVALHHHPFPHASRTWQWIDGLRGCERLMAALAEHPNVHVFHGHLHYEVERAVAGRTCIFGATATVEDPIDAPRIRTYDVAGTRLERAIAIERAAA